MRNDLILDYIDLSGFMSFPPNKNYRIQLNTNKLTTIIGENLDGGDGERNGVGKSAIIDAILYLLFGRSPRVSNQGFINYVYPGSMSVSGSGSRNGISFYIERGENPSFLRIFEKPIKDIRDFRHKEDGKFIFDCTKSTKPETNKRIIELIGFDIKLADVLIASNPSDKACFFLKTEEEQRNIIERIFGFTIFTEKAELLREMRKEETRNLSNKESIFIATKQANDRVIDEIKQLEQKSIEWIAERDHQINLWNQKINYYDNVDFTNEIKILTEINNVKIQIENFERDLKNYESTANSNKKRSDQWVIQHKNTIIDLEKQLTVLESSNPEEDIKIILRKDELKPIILETKQCANNTSIEIENTKKQLEGYYQTKTRLQKQIEIIEKQIIDLNESICPTCGQPWADTKDHIVSCVSDLDKNVSFLEEIDENIKTYHTNLENLEKEYKKQVKAANDIIEEFNKLQPLTFKTIEEANNANYKKNIIIKKLEEEKKSINPYIDIQSETEKTIKVIQKKIEKLKKELKNKPQTLYQTLSDAEESQRDFEFAKKQLENIKNMYNPYDDTISNLRNKAIKIIDDTEIKDIKTKIAHISLLIKLLSDRDSPIRKSIMDEWLPELNHRINNYLEFLELPHRMIFDSNMTATFFLKNKELNFGNLSTGQRLRVWLATNLAFREIFELINYKINLFFVDEVLDKGMSSRGAEVSYRLLEKMVEQQKSIFLISHRQELVDMSDCSMTIVLENGLSNILI